MSDHKRSSITYTVEVEEKKTQLAEKDAVTCKSWVKCVFEAEILSEFICPPT